LDKERFQDKPQVTWIHSIAFHPKALNNNVLVAGLLTCFVPTPSQLLKASGRGCWIKVLLRELKLTATGIVLDLNRIPF